METLYHLLGALPNDDAEGLRSAFRTAVKGAHPDINPGDPEAALKFRQIVRANDILGDPEQRAVYDHLLELARIEQEQTTKTAVIVGKIHRAASGVLALAGFSVVAVGGYALFMHVSAASVAPAHEHEMAARGTTEIAALAPAERPAADVRILLPDRAEDANTTTGTVGLGSASSRIDPVGTQPADPAPPLDLTARDARSYRERGISAYRNGDIDSAIADFDQAIQIDPKFADAYIDRGIAFYRLRKFERAFADIDRARNLQKANRSKPAPALTKRQRLRQAHESQAGAAHRTARLD
jgi:curved DNA-binding protein CbpA